MLVYFEDLLVEHLAVAISSVGTEWQKGNRMERKEQNMLTMQKAKTKKRPKKRTFLDGCTGVETQKHGEANKHHKADDGWGGGGLKHAGLHTSCVKQIAHVSDKQNTRLFFQ